MRHFIEAFFDLFSSSTPMHDNFPAEPASSHLSDGVNPATGLPMMVAGIDVGGNPYGFDLHDAHASSAFDACSSSQHSDSSWTSDASSSCSDWSSGDWSSGGSGSSWD